MIFRLAWLGAPDVVLCGVNCVRDLSAMNEGRSLFSAAEQGLGFIYQPRFALLKVLSLPESTAVLLEKADDLEFDTAAGSKSLVSLKHKAVGDRLTDLDTDFWKSIRIWLKHYVDNGRVLSDANFMLFTTAEISATSFLKMFAGDKADSEALTKAASAVLASSQAKSLATVQVELGALTDKELEDFYSRVMIFDGSLRITDIPQLAVDQHLRTIRREFRKAVFERLEGWWIDLTIKMLAGERTTPLYVYEVSDKLSATAEEYRSDNLPITFRNRLPDGKIDVAGDPRLFVEQLRDLDLSPSPSYS